MGNERTVAKKFKEFISLFAKGRFVRQKPVRQAVHIFGSRGHWALRVEIRVVVIACHHPADHFDAANFNHPIPSCGVKASRFGIKYNFTHSVIRCEPV